MSRYSDRVVSCDSCGFGTHSEPGQLLPDEWHHRDGQAICPSCWTRPLRTYLTAAGWTRREEQLVDGVLEPELWHDPQSTRRWLELDAAFGEQQKRDGYDQMELS